jgi:hypothetical protein
VKITLGNNRLLKSEIHVIFSTLAGSNPRLGDTHVGERRDVNASETFCTQPETMVEFFYFFARNPLKSPDSDEQNQGNPSNFAWFYLVLLGGNSRAG